MKLLPTIIFSFAILSCEKKKEQAAESKVVKADEAREPKLSYDDLFKLENYLAGDQPATEVYVIDFDCAVFVYPTHQQVEEMKKTLGEDDFYTIADDSNFYQTQAIQILDSLGIKTIGTEKRFIKFVGTVGSWTLDIRKKDLPQWNLILFQKNKTPQPSAAISLTYESAKNYFE